MKFRYSTEIRIEPESRRLTKASDLTLGVWYELAKPIPWEGRHATHIRRSNYDYDEEFRLGIPGPNEVQLVSVLVTLPQIKRRMLTPDIYILTEGEIDVSNNV